MDNTYDIFKAQQAAKIRACYGEDPIEKSGEGSKGGKVVGHTKSGKAIYAHDSSPHGIKGEYGDHIEHDYLHEHLAQSSSKEDFRNKVLHGITDEKSHLGSKTDQKLHEYYEKHVEK